MRETFGEQYEPLVDRFYIAQKRWSRSLASAHAQHDQAFGDRKYEHSPEIAKAFQDTCERSGVREPSDALAALHKEMKLLENAINAAPVTSIEGLRVKALVAFYEVAPLGAGDSEFSFEDAYPFQQLFTAVAQACGLNEKILATGYKLPDLGMCEAAPDEDEEDEQA